jgi:hypothetical protein
VKAPRGALNATQTDFRAVVDHRTAETGETTVSAKIQTCTNYRGDGLALHELEHGGTRHRWHCLDCDEKGPVEVDAAVSRYQLTQHIQARHLRTADGQEKPAMSREKEKS